MELQGWAINWIDKNKKERADFSSTLSYIIITK